MEQTENLGLNLISNSAEDKQMKFSAWRAKIAGTGDDSNMKIIDAAVGDLQEAVEKTKELALGAYEEIEEIDKNSIALQNAVKETPILFHKTFYPTKSNYYGGYWTGGESTNCLPLVVRTPVVFRQSSSNNEVVISTLYQGPYAGLLHAEGTINTTVGSDNIIWIPLEKTVNISNSSDGLNPSEINFLYFRLSEEYDQTESIKFYIKDINNNSISLLSFDSDVCELEEDFETHITHIGIEFVSSNEECNINTIFTIALINKNDANGAFETYEWTPPFKNDNYNVCLIDDTTNLLNGAKWFHFNNDPEYYETTVPFTKHTVYLLKATLTSEAVEILNSGGSLPALEGNSIRCSIFDCKDVFQADASYLLSRSGDSYLFYTIIGSEAFEVYNGRENIVNVDDDTTYMLITMPKSYFENISLSLVDEEKDPSEYGIISSETNQKPFPGTPVISDPVTPVIPDPSGRL